MFSWTQHKDVEKDNTDVSKMAKMSAFTLPLHSLRKRVTSRTTKISQDDLIELQKCKINSDDKQSLTSIGKNRKIHPYDNKNLEEFGFFSRKERLDKKSSSRESSDMEIETYVGKRRQKNVSYKNEEKSTLICYKDNNKVITMKNDSKLTKYNTFDMKCTNKHRLVKYQSLDIPNSAKTIVKYVEPQNKLSISAEDFRIDYKPSKVDRRKHCRDIITDTVDAWAKKSGKNVFLNLKNSLFCSSTDRNKEIVYKPLIFGGTYPIDCPTFSNKIMKRSVSETTKLNSQINMKQPNISKLREYGPPRTFNIDQPI